MIKELADLNDPPTTLSDFMPLHKIVNKVDDLLYRRLEACLPNITPFLDEQPSRESGPHSRLEAPRGAGEVPLETSVEAMEGEPSLEVPRGTGSEGGLEAPRGAVHVTCIGDEAPTPVVVRREFLGGEDTDSDEPLPIPYRLKGKGRGTVNTPIELTTDDDKENHDDTHPGEGWITFDPNNREHYVVAAEDAAGDVHAAKFIKYVMTEDGPFVHGCDRKGAEVFKKPLEARSEDARPNLLDNGQIRDDLLYALAPTSKLRDMVDRHVHDMKDPGLTADIARYRARTATQEELTAQAKKLKERLHSNHDDLIATTHRLIYARVPTRLFRRVFADENPLDPLRGPHPYRRPLPTHPRFCYECWEVLPSHRTSNCPRRGQCCFCSHPNHSAVACTAPHLKCTEVDCFVPSWHPNHGGACSAPPAARIKRLLISDPSIVIHPPV